jgi:trans-aconitate 2-methyltransferase
MDLPHEAPVSGPAHGTGWDGSAYDRVAALQRWVADRSLAELHLQGDERVLDVGCGDGRVTAEVADRVPYGSVLGIDPSPGMLAAAEARRHPGLSFAAGAVETMTYVDRFDVVLSFNALHWVADHDRALTAIARALVPGGRALLQLVCDGERPSIEDVALETTARAAWTPYFDGMTPPFHHPLPGELAAAAEAAGLAVHDLRVDDLQWDFGDADALRSWCRAGFSDWLGRLPTAEVRSAFVSEVATAYASVVGDDHSVRFLQLRLELQRER